jgi:ABC-type uncharacterized transport system substrate-binding protein
MQGSAAVVGLTLLQSSLLAQAFPSRPEEEVIPFFFNSAAFWVAHGALASYGPDAYASGRQAARLVHKILHGADPAELPVEANSNIEFVINLKVAKALGLTIPPEMLYRADRLIR